MNAFSLEDFAAPTAVRHSEGAAKAAPRPDDRYDEGYAAGWEDAVAQRDAEQGRIGEELAARLTGLALDRQAAMGTVLQSLEPVFRDIFDRLLPLCAGRALLPVVMGDLASILEQGPATAEILVAPEEAAALAAMIARSGISPEEASVVPEAALSLSQAQIRWPGGERRIDLDGALTALDDALDAFLESLGPRHDAAGPQMKEA